MKINEIEFQDAADDRVELRCPICNAVWLSENPEESEIREMKPCKHLRFMGPDEGAPTYYGRWRKKDFIKAYVKKEAEIDEEDEPNDDVESMRWDVLEALECNQIDEVAALTESGMACGPVSFSTFFGLKRS